MCLGVCTCVIFPQINAGSLLYLCHKHLLAWPQISALSEISAWWPQISALSEISAWSQISAWVKAAATFQWEAMELGRCQKGGLTLCSLS